MPQHLLDQIGHDLHHAVMAVERANEALHRATVLGRVADADRSELGDLFVQHVHCCWDDDLAAAVRDRLRELVDAEVSDLCNQAPF